MSYGQFYIPHGYNKANSKHRCEISSFGWPEHNYADIDCTNCGHDKEGSRGVKVSLIIYFDGLEEQKRGVAYLKLFKVTQQNTLTVKELKRGTFDL